MALLYPCCICTRGVIKGSSLNARMLIHIQRVIASAAHCIIKPRLYVSSSRRMLSSCWKMSGNNYMQNCVKEYIIPQHSSASSTPSDASSVAHKNPE